jgi:Signal transduction histidine kinase
LATPDDRPHRRTLGGAALRAAGDQRSQTSGAPGRQRAGVLRITDVADVYSFDSLSIAEIVDDVLRDLATVISEKGFEVTVAIPPDSRGARRPSRAAPAPRQRLDNAIKYSSATRSIAVTARYEAPMVVVTVSDKGAGILARELDQVTRRFFRGRARRRAATASASRS